MISVAKWCNHAGPNELIQWCVTLCTISYANANTCMCKCVWKIQRANDHFNVQCPGKITVSMVDPIKYVRSHALLCLWSNLPIFFRVALLALGQSYDCPSASEATLTRSHKSMVAKTNKNMWKLFAYFMGYTHLHILWDILICIFYGLYCMFSVFNTFTHLYLLTPKWCRIVTKILVNNGSDNGLCCSQTASSYYLNQCWLKITGIHPNAISQKIRKMWWKNYHFKLFF